jgi:hypothetical protein
MAPFRRLLNFVATAIALGIVAYFAFDYFGGPDDFPTKKVYLCLGLLVASVAMQATRDK